MGEEVPGRRADWKVCAAFRDWPYGQQMWAEGWGVRLGGMLGERREAGGGMSGRARWSRSGSLDATGEVMLRPDLASQRAIWLLSTEWLGAAAIR